jgi:integrase
MARGCVFAKTRANGSKSWHVMVDLPRIEGLPRKRHHRGGFATKKAAQSYLSTLLGRIEGEQFVEPSKKALGEFMDSWLAAVSPDLRASTRAGFRTHIDVHVKPRIGAVPLQKVTPLLLDEFYRELLNNGRADGRGSSLSPNTVRRIHATIRLALAYGVKKRLLMHNPALDADPPRTRTAEITVWTPTELRTFLDHVGDHPETLIGVQLEEGAVDHDMRSLMSQCGAPSPLYSGRRPVGLHCRARQVTVDQDARRLAGTELGEPKHVSLESRVLIDLHMQMRFKEVLDVDDGLVPVREEASLSELVLHDRLDL